MCSYGNAEIYYNQNRKIFPRSQSAGEWALQCSVRVFLIYTKCVQEHCIPGPTGAGFLGLLLMLFVCLFIVVVSSGASWDRAAGSAVVMAMPFFCQLRLPPPSSGKFLKTGIVCLSPSQKPSLTHRGSMGTWGPGGEGDCNLQYRLQDETVLRPFVKGATELVLRFFSRGKPSCLYLVHEEELVYPPGAKIH